MENAGHQCAGQQLEQVVGHKNYDEWCHQANPFWQVSQTITIQVDNYQSWKLAMYKKK